MALNTGMAAKSWGVILVPHLRRFKRIIWREVNLDHENTSCIWTVWRPAKLKSRTLIGKAKLYASNTNRATLTAAPPTI
jgi:hypothetical protein